MKDLTTAQKKLAQELFNIGVVKFGDFKLKLHDTNPDAPLSPIYIDLRLLRRFPKAKMAAVEVYKELLKPLKFDLLIDIPFAATPIVSSLSDELNIGMITPRKDTKTHGSGAKVDGLLDEDKGKIGVMIDDLVTMAISATNAAELLREEGIKVKDLVVLIDREQGGAAQLKSVGIDLHFAFTMDQMFSLYLTDGIITNEQFNDIEKRIADLNEFMSDKK